MIDLIAIGEPLVELAAESTGRLGDVERFRRGWGGDTANCLLAAARLGGACGYVTRVGDDEFGRAFVALLERNGIDASQVGIDAAHHTGVYLCPTQTNDSTGSRTFAAIRRRVILPVAISIPSISEAPASCTRAASRRRFRAPPQTQSRRR